MIKIYEELEQGTDEWLQARCGVLTASEMKLVITKTLKIASNDKVKAHMYELAAQRITNYTEPCYISDDMLRGEENEIIARDLYSENYAKVDEVGFITSDAFGFTLGYSPDGLVGKTGLIEIKSRRQKFQAETIMKDEVPDEYMMQIQTGLLITGREWCDFISYSAGLPMYVKRVKPCPEHFAAIEAGARDFHAKMAEAMFSYDKNVKKLKLVATERNDEEDIV